MATERQSAPAQGEVYSGDKSPGKWVAMSVILRWEVVGFVRSEIAVWRPVIPAPRMVMCCVIFGGVTWEGRFEVCGSCVWWWMDGWRDVGLLFYADHGGQ